MHGRPLEPHLWLDADREAAPKASSGNIFAADLSQQVATAARTAASSGVRRRVCPVLRLQFDSVQFQP